MELIKSKIKSKIKLDNENNIFKEQIEYVMLDGKMLRGIITLSICNNINYALIVEYIHNSSLIIDDMPCMDNDDQRRNKLSAHKKYGENKALLLSSTLLVNALQNLNICIKELDKPIINILNNEINNEINNLITGQYMDINKDMTYVSNLKSMPPRLQKKNILKLIKYKTGSLFSLAILLGYIGKYKKIDEYNDLNNIKKIGICFGLCFQILDDLADYYNENENKNINIKTYFTKNELIDLFSDNIDYFRNTLIDYKLYNKILNDLYLYLLKEFKARMCPRHAFAQSKIKSLN